MNPLNELFDYIKRNMVGIIVGIAAALFYANSLKDISFATQTQSIIDPLFQGAKDFARTKVNWGLAWAGAIIGGQAQELMRKWR